MKIAVLGAGSMGEMHAYAYHEMPDVEVAIIYGRDLEKITPLAKRIGAAATVNLDDLLTDSTIEAVDVCAPTPVHRELVIPVLEAGKHVFCETPLALTLEDAQSMLAASKASNRLLLVGLLMRSIPEYQYIKQALGKDELGKPLAAYAYRLGSYLHKDGRDAKAHYSDPTTELMTFDFDVLNWLLGQPNQLYATASNLPDGRRGHVIANLEYDNLIAEVEASGIMPPSFPYSIGFRIVGEEQAFEITTKFPKDGPPETTLMSYPSNGGPETIKVGEVNPYAAECQYFVNCIRGEADPALLSAERATEALRLSLATQQSLKQNRAIPTKF